MSDSEDREKSEREAERVQLRSRIERISVERGLGVAALDAVTNRLLVDDKLCYVAHLVSNERIVERLAAARQARPDLFVQPAPTPEDAPGPKDPEFRKFLGKLAPDFDKLKPETRRELAFKFEALKNAPDPAERLVKEYEARYGQAWVEKATRVELAQLSDVAGVPRGPAAKPQTGPIPPPPPGVIGQRKLDYFFTQRQKLDAEQRLLGLQGRGDLDGVARTEREIKSLQARIGAIVG